MPESPRISPYLTVRGAAEAIDFYRRAFGAEETGRHMTDDGQRIMHAALTINGGTIMLSDEFPEHGGVGPLSLGGTPVSISLHFDTREAVDATHQQALDSGATTLMDPQDPFWGGRFAMLTDPFGHRWMLVSAH